VACASACRASRASSAARPSRRSAGDERPVLLRREAEAVDRGERVLQRLRAEDDRERVRAALLVEGAETVGQTGLRDPERDARDPQLPGDRRPLAGHGVGARPHLGGATLGGPHLRLQRVELEHGRARSRRQHVVGAAELGGPAGRLRAGGGERRNADGRDGGDCQNRRQSADGTVHGAGH
jgi:hypothetical protein